MPKLILLSIALIVIIATGIITVFFNNNGVPKTIPKSVIDTAVNQARHIYNQEKARNRDFSEGPCLSEALMPDWVLDIVHNPRLPIDDLPENQCSALREGRAKHFVELDTLGNLIRAQ